MDWLKKLLEGGEVGKKIKGRTSKIDDLFKNEEAYMGKAKKKPDEEALDKIMTDMDEYDYNSMKPSVRIDIGTSSPTAMLEEEEEDEEV